MSERKVIDIKAFVPAKDLELSKRFYQDLGFNLLWAENEICEMERDGHKFLLQRFHVKEHAENFMMSLNVEDTEAWWKHVQEAELKEKYGLGMCKAPALQPWGLKVLFLSDPSGILWHIVERPKR